MRQPSGAPRDRAACSDGTLRRDESMNRWDPKAAVPAEQAKRLSLLGGAGMPSGEARFSHPPSPGPHSWQGRLPTGEGWCLALEKLQKTKCLKQTWIQERGRWKWQRASPTSCLGPIPRHHIWGDITSGAAAGLREACVSRDQPGCLRRQPCPSPQLSRKGERPGGRVCSHQCPRAAALSLHPP